MKFEVNEIYTLKIASGEEFVAKVSAVTDTTVTVVKPATVVPDETGNMQLVPALITADHDKDVEFNISQIVAAVPTRGTIADGYRTKVSGIQTPSKNIILG